MTTPEDLARELADIKATLADPNAVHVNLLAGRIARPSVSQIIHIYGADTILTALQAPAPQGDVVEAVRKAAATFRRYGDLHAAKPDPAKAKRNYDLADEMDAALASLPSAEAGAEPVAVIRFDRTTPGNENEMPKVLSCNWLPDGEYQVFLHPTEAAPVADAQAIYEAEANAAGVNIPWSEASRNTQVLDCYSEAEIRADEREKMQHVAYFDEGAFHWMSGIKPRDCELYAIRSRGEG